MWQPDVDARDEKEHDLIAEEFVKVRHQKVKGKLRFSSLSTLHLGTVHIVRKGSRGEGEVSQISINCTRRRGVSQNSKYFFGNRRSIGKSSFFLQKIPEF